MQIHLTLIGFMKIINTKKFVMVGSWWRVEIGPDHKVNKIYDTLDSMGFGVEVSKLHV